MVGEFVLFLSFIWLLGYKFTLYPCQLSLKIVYMDIYMCVCVFVDVHIVCSFAICSIAFWLLSSEVNSRALLNVGKCNDSLGIPTAYQPWLEFDPVSSMMSSEWGTEKKKMRERSASQRRGKMLRRRQTDSRPHTVKGFLFFQDRCAL